MMLNYNEIHENRRVIHTDTVSWEINLDRERALWKVRPLEGKVPKDLDQEFTTARHANIAIANWMIAAKRVK